MLRRCLPRQRLATAVLATWLAVVLLTANGCAWFQQLKGPGFGYDTSGGGMRGKNTDAKPSGFLFDKRSEEIEKNLGGF